MAASYTAGFMICMCVSLWAWWVVVAAHHWVHYACCHLQADCWSPGSAPAPYAQLRVWVRLPFYDRNSEYLTCAERTLTYYSTARRRRPSETDTEKEIRTETDYTGNPRNRESERARETYNVGPMSVYS